jgi:hypothetical protein
LFHGLSSGAGGQFRVSRAHDDWKCHLSNRFRRHVSFPPSFPIAEICCALRSTYAAGNAKDGDRANPWFSCVLVHLLLRHV